MTLCVSFTPQDVAFWLFFSILFYLPIVYVKRIWFHPLSKYPGPRLWAATRIPYVVSLIRGTLIHDMSKMHEKYGDVVRIGKDELSFATEEAWRDIYSHRPGHKECKKDARWYLGNSLDRYLFSTFDPRVAPNDMPQNIVTTTDIHVRARMRRLLAPSFNDKSLSAQEPVLEMYANRLVERLEEIYHTAKSQHSIASADFLEWINFYSMDIIGDLALGESFHCLDESDYHPWVKTLYTFFKGMIFAASTRFFPWIELLIQYLIPKQILEMQKRHTEFTNTKILQRLELRSNRPDLVTPFLREMEKSPDKMTLGEIQSTFAILLVAGSETTSTILVGLFSKLAKHEKIQEKLHDQLIERFASLDDITVASTKDMPYLDAVIEETLRLCYAIPGGLPRVVPEGGDIFAGHFVPGGTHISIRPHVVLNSERYFRRSREFIPERWLPLEQRPDEFKNDVLGASQPFSLGPTNCIGKSLAYAEMRLVVAKIIWNFKLSPVKGKPFDWASLHKMMVVEKRPLWLHFEKRSD